MNQVTFHDQDLWKEIYDLALAYGKREAWNYYWDNDIFEVPLADGRASHCSIFGKAGELFGLCVYVGDSGLDSLKRMHYHHLAGISPESAWKCQECIGLFWGDRDEVAEEQYSIIKQLGLKFRGRGKWIYTEVYHKNYAPACPSDEEAVILKETLEKLLSMLDLATPDWNKPNQYHSDLTFISEKNGKIVCRETKNGQYPIDEIGAVDKSREFALKAAARKKVPAMMARTLEAGVYYMGAMFEDDLGRSFHGRIALLLDQGSGMILDQMVLIPEESVGQVLTDMLCDYVEREGLPKKVLVPNVAAQKRIAPLTSFIKLNVQVGDMPAMMEALRSMHEYGIGSPIPDGLPSMPPMTEEQSEKLMDGILDVLGMDRETMAKMAEKMSQRQFEDKFVGKLIDRIIDSGLPDVLSKAADRLGSPFPANLRRGRNFDGFDDDVGDFDEEDFDDFDEADFDDFDEDDFLDDDLWDLIDPWQHPDTRKRKVEAIRDFFGRGQIPDEEYEEYDKYLSFDLADMTQSELIAQGTKQELLDMAKGANLPVKNNEKKADIAGALVAEVDRRKKGEGASKGKSAASKKALQELMGEEVVRLQKYIHDKLKWEEKHGRPWEEDPADFGFSMETVLEALRWGIIDVDYGWSDVDLVLCLMVCR